MNQVWAWFITGLVTGVMSPGALLVLRRWPRWHPPRLRAIVIGGGFVLVHGAITISLVVGFRPLPWAGLHLVLLAAGIVYWCPILDRRQRLVGPDLLAYAFLTSPALDFAGMVVVALGHPVGGVAMIVGMLPLNFIALQLIWRRLADEEKEAARSLAEGARLVGRGGAP